MKNSPPPRSRFALGRLCLGLLALCGGPVFAAEKSARPNIILLESDDHHFQALGCMGEPVRTPHIDALAARGVLFRNSICQGTACAPSRNSLITGSYPHQTGVYYNQDGNMAAGVWTMPAALQRAGYVTALVGKNHFKPASQYTGRPAAKPSELALEETRSLGFDHLHSTAGKVSAAAIKSSRADPYRTYLEEKGLLKKFQEDFAKARTDKSVAASPSILSAEDQQDGYIATKAIEWLRDGERGGKPFFLWVDFVAPHPPADPPEPYASMYDWQQMRPALPRPAWMPALPRAAAKRTPEMIQRFRAGYYGMISSLDAQIGRIMRTLEERGELDNTVIVFAGDQGSMLGDLGLWGKGVFFKGSVNSPLVIAGPKSFQQGRVVDRPVELLDLAPTFLALARASEADRKSCQGQSLLPLLTGAGEYQRTTAFAEEADTQMAVDERYKFVKHAKEPMLFDLREDPDEMNNLSGKLPEVEARLTERIADWLAATPPVRPPNMREVKAAK